MDIKTQNEQKRNQKKVMQRTRSTWGKVITKSIENDDEGKKG
jgi:hypothetical protein